jgi:hypothetical protein
LEIIFAGFVPPPDDARQRPVFRHHLRPRWRWNNFNCWLLIFHAIPPGQRERLP